MKLRSGEDPGFYGGLISAEELEAMRERVGRHPALRQEYARQKELSEQFAVEAMKAPLAEQANERTQPFVFRVPEGAGYLKISIHIAGQGSARIREMRMTHSQRGLPVQLSNANFAQDLAHWRVEVKEGSRLELQPVPTNAAAMQPSGVTPANGTDPVHLGNAQMVRIVNTLEEADTVLHYETPIPVREEDHYSVQVTLGLEAPLTVGVYTKVGFCDVEGNPLRAASLCSPPFNRATPTPWAYFLEAAGAEANRFMLEGDAASAERCKQKLLYMLYDIIPGMGIFKETGWHADDIYGAVHIGRGLAVLSVIYRQIAPSGVIDEEETAMLLAYFRYIAKLMMDTGYYRFDLEEFPDEKGGKRSNWNADRATGLGVYALLFPEERNAEAYLKHALSVVDWQLEQVVDDTGAWPENIRYHGAVLHRYFLFFALLKRFKGLDYFRHGKVEAMYRFLIGTAVSPDRIQAGPDGGPVMLTPAVGDANVQEHWFRLLVYAAPFYRETDPKLAGEMMWIWRRGGSPVRDSGAFPYPLAPLWFAEPDLPEEAPELHSIHYPGMGYVIFRNPQSPNRFEHYAIYEASPLTYHAHYDEGHFSIWCDQVPLALDSGTGGYYNGDRHWYVSSAAHNVMQFAESSGAWREVPLRSQWEKVHFSAELDVVVSRIPDPTVKAYRRHFAFIKAGLEVYLIWDHIQGDAERVWNLHTLSTDAEIGEQHIEARCLGEMRLSTLIAEPRQPLIEADLGALAGNYPLSVQQHFRVQGHATEDFLILLHPHRDGEPPVHLENVPLEHSSPEVRCYKIVHAAGAWCAVVVNGSPGVITINTGDALGPMRMPGGRDRTIGGKLDGTFLEMEAGSFCILLPQD
ncbi:heparinase II/III domain-containing protein [Paenibacillus sanfengchensis]|uniref:heparinase II/III domain-containing protein n=1 Tax=Paenibacillus sanfengchensis TaxID=3119819 RepID=UPI002FDFC863